MSAYLGQVGAFLSVTLPMLGIILGYLRSNHRVLMTRIDGLDTRLALVEQDVRALRPPVGVEGTNLK